MFVLHFVDLGLERLFLFEFFEFGVQRTVNCIFEPDAGEHFTEILG